MKKKASKKSKRSTPAFRVTRFRNLRHAKSYAAQAGKWVFPDEDGDGYIVVGSRAAQELTDAGIMPL